MPPLVGNSNKSPAAGDNLVKGGVSLPSSGNLWYSFWDCMALSMRTTQPSGAMVQGSTLGVTRITDGGPWVSEGQRTAVWGFVVLRVLSLREVFPLQWEEGRLNVCRRWGPVACAGEGGFGRAAVPLDFQGAWMSERWLLLLLSCNPNLRFELSQQSST